MILSFVDRVELDRKRRNKELVEDVKNGTYKAAFDKEQSWWPSRQVIKKDKSAITKLYGDETEILDPN